MYEGSVGRLVSDDAQMKAVYLLVHFVIAIGLLAVTQFAFLVFMPAYALIVFLGPDLRNYFRRRHTPPLVVLAVSALAQTSLLAILVGTEWLVLARTFDFDWPAPQAVLVGVVMAYAINALGLAILRNPSAGPGIPTTPHTTTTP